MSQLFLTVIATLFLSSAAVGFTADAPPIGLANEAVTNVARAKGLEGEIVLSDQNGLTTDVVLGLSDRKAQKPHVAGQRWLWASVTKQITATLVLQEIDRGRLKLDGSLGTYLPTFGGNRSITVRQLLQHQSGLPNPTDTATDADGVQPFYRETGGSISDTARAMGFCAGASSRAPGGDFDYNNCDYIVLGAVLESVTDKSFEQLVKMRIARPLGLRTLRMAPVRAIRGGAAAVGYDGVKILPPLNVRTFGAAGALTGSANELAIFDRALMTGRLLSSATRTLAWSGDPKLGYQALGVWAYPARLKGCTSSVQIVERRGDVDGTQVRNVIAPELGRAVIIFTNDAAVDFGEVWQGKGLMHDILAAALCPSST